MQAKLLIISIQTIGIFAVPAVGNGYPNLSEMDLMNAGADEEADLLNLFLMDANGRLHNVGGLMLRFSGTQDPVYAIQTIMGEFYGANAISWAFRAVFSIPAVLSVLKSSLG